jgi:hypothetical protein
MYRRVRDFTGGAEDSAWSQDDAPSSTEYAPVFHSRSFAAPEVKLMAAVLDDAIICFKKYATAKQCREQRLFRQTEAWLFGEDSTWPFSFENLCEFLEINPSYLRGGLLRLKQQLEARGRKTERRSVSDHIRLQRED